MRGMNPTAPIAPAADLLARLNPEQREAVLHGDGPLLVIAGAGTGKTNTLVHRLAHLLLSGADPRRILLMTFSRRTPMRARELLAARLGHLPGMIWDGEGANPYFAFLAAADYVLVTEDSTNMATEAASTGKPVFVLKMDGHSHKFRLFHEELEGRGAARPFGGAFHGWTYEPLRETDRLASEVLTRMAARAS